MNDSDHRRAAPKKMTATMPTHQTTVPAPSRAITAATAAIRRPPTARDSQKRRFVPK
jgi:hypothetical protein